MLKKIVFGSFYHPFQDGYKSSVLQILFPWLVQGSYLKRLLQYFLYAGTVTKCWCSVGMFFAPSAKGMSQSIRVFRKLTKLAIMAILTSEALLREKNPVPVGIEPRQPLILSPTLFFPH